MGKPSRRPNRNAQMRQYRERRSAYRALRQAQKEQGLEPPQKPTVSNRKSPLTTVEQEQTARQEAVEGQLKVFRTLLPQLLQGVAQIPDPRNPKTVQHQLTAVLLYGLLCFVYQMASRREANRQMTMATFQENLRLQFPELVRLPHADTLHRLLQQIDVEQIQALLVQQVQRLIRNKKFQPYTVQGHYLVAIDGTQKFTRDTPLAPQALQRERTAGQGETKTQYFTYVLEANLVLGPGLSLPLLSEFLEYPDGDPLTQKQECELSVFPRLAQRLKSLFPRLPIMMLLDGLYPNGPVFSLCRRYGWEFMTVLQNTCLPQVWEEFEGLKRLQPGQTLEQAWQGRRQHFQWVNDITYDYGRNRRDQETVHTVVCDEQWETLAQNGTEVEQKTSRHAWVCSLRLTKNNVHSLCNLAGRNRWAMENNIQDEKRRGYEYEHVFSYDWNAMKGYHYLMRLAHFLNVLVRMSLELSDRIAAMGTGAFLDFVRNTMTARWLDPERIHRILARDHQLRFT